MIHLLTFLLIGTCNLFSKLKTDFKHLKISKNVLYLEFLEKYNIYDQINFYNIYSID